MNEKKISIIQLAIEPAKPTENRQRAVELIEKAAEGKPDIIMLPEMWTTAYELENIKAICDRDGEPTLSIMRGLAKKYNVNIVAGSFANMVNDKVYNSAFVIDRNGDIVGSYNKIHLFKLMDEDKHISPGSEVCIFEIDGIRCGLIICYDLRFPELSRRLALSGVKILFVPAQWPGARLEHWNILLRARAIENQIFVAAANRAGKNEKDVFIGGSALINPWGQLVAGADYNEQIINTTFTLDTIEEVKSKIDIYIDRVPQMYSID